MLRLKSLAIPAAFFCLISTLLGAAPERRVLVYTKNQTGTNEAGKKLYVHDNLAASVAAIKKLGAENDFLVDASDDPKSFTSDNLKKYKALIFSNTNNEIFDNEEQKAAFREYIRTGGGFVGIHSATGSMRQWPWFWEMIGGKFSRHAKMQTFTVYVNGPTDISTAQFPKAFQWTDEFYFCDHMPSDLQVLLMGDLTKLDDPDKVKSAGPFKDRFPLAWKHHFDGGREWYTSLGRQKEHYSDPKFTKHLLGGILWAMGEEKEVK